MSGSATNVTNEYSVEVNLLGTSLDPERITSILGIEATKSAKVGQPRRKGQDDSVYDESFWAYEVSSRDDINECRDYQILCVADIIEPKVDLLKEAGVERIYFYYTLSSFYGMMNVRLKAETMDRLARIGADLYLTGFDCFNPKHPFWQDGQEEVAETTSSDDQD